MDDQPFEVPRQSRTTTQVIGDHRTQRQTEATAMVISQTPLAFHHHDVQAVMRVVEDARVAAIKQVIEHALRALTDLGHGHAFVEILLGVELAEAADACGGVRQASAGEAPGTDRGANQRTLTRRTRQPFTEQRQIQPLNPQRLRPTGRTGQGADVSGVQALRANPRHGARAGLEGEGGELDVDGGHTGLDR